MSGSSSRRLYDRLGRPKRDYTVDRNGNPVRLHESANPWRPSMKAEKTVRENTNEILLRNARALMNKLSEASMDELLEQFVQLRVHESPAIGEVISIIFDKAAEEPRQCALYASLCSAQVQSELDQRGDGEEGRSQFESAIRMKVRTTFNTKTIEENVEDGLRRTRMGHVLFIGHLYLEKLIALRFMHFRTLDLLKSIDEEQVDEQSLECAVHLLEKIGKRMDEDWSRSDKGERLSYQLQSIIDKLQQASSRVSTRVRLLIINLVDYRNSGWREKKEIPAWAPRKLDELKEEREKKKEEEENEMAERRQLPGRGFRGGNRGAGGRGWDSRNNQQQQQEEEQPRQQRPMQILMRRDQSPSRGAAAAPTDAVHDTTSSSSTTTVMGRHQRGTLDSTGVLAMLTGGGGIVKQRDQHPAAAAAATAGPSAAATLQQGRPGATEVRRVEQKRHDKMAARHGSSVSSLPSTQSTSAPWKDVVYLGGKKVMRDACKIVGDSGELSEYLTSNMVADFLSDTNREFRVIAAVGPQTTGKSTILSMLAGNQPLDLFRQYVFRPSSREAVEQSKHQTIKVALYVSKSRNIYIDCQPMSSASMLDEQIRGAPRDRGTSGFGLQMQIENLQILAWALQVSHTVLVCHDWFLDIDIIRQLRTAELLRAATDEVAVLNQLPKIAAARKTNLLFVHTRARPNDFRPANRKERVAILKRLFGGSLRLRLVDTPESLRWEGPRSLPRPPLESAYFPLAEMKLREMSSNWQDERGGGGGGGHHHHRSNHGPMSPALHHRAPQQRGREKEKEGDHMKELLADLSGAIPFDEGIVTLKRVLQLLPADSFTAAPAAAASAPQPLTEVQWFRLACGIWRDATFRASVALLEQSLGGSDGATSRQRDPRARREPHPPPKRDVVVEKFRGLRVD